ncbi:MAG: hypothetical protein WDN04_21225 [Rhodospirillales bacterium]
MISMREGIEAFLIVAMTLAYVRKTGREPLVSAVYWGTGVAAGDELYRHAVFPPGGKQAVVGGTAGGGRRG